MMFTPHNIKAPFLRPTERPVTCKPMNPVTNSIARPIIDTFFDALLQRVVRVFVSSCEKNIILIGDTATSGNDIPGQGSGNNTDMGVNGRRDLLDFFPVMMDIRGFEERFGRPDSYRLKQADAALSAVYSRLGNGNANGFQTTEADYYGPGLNAHARSAVSMPVISGGTQLSDSFVSWVRQTGGVGVFLVEGIGASSSPLVLEAVKNGAVVASCELPMRVAPVEQMFTRADGRDGPFDVDYGYALPPFNGTNVVFLHGFKVSAAAAREWHCETFKRLWQSGSNARFHGVTWKGDEALLAPPVGVAGFHYHENVDNAFQAASHLRDYVDDLSGEKIMMAHSLGNMVVSSAIADHGMGVGKYFMLNAAVPSEAYDTGQWDDSPDASNVMAHEYWQPYTNICWSAKFHEFFTGNTADDRRLLTWKNRFGGVLTNTAAYNFWSSGDEVFELTEGTPNSAWDGLTSGYVRYSWHKQETHKGRGALDPAGTSWAGWGFESSLITQRPAVTSSWSGVVGPGISAVNGAPPAPPTEHILYSELGEHPVFLRRPAAMFISNIPFNLRNEILAKGIPALSESTGRTAFVFPVNIVEPRNFNMNMDFMPDDGIEWPRNSGDYDGRWCHSDMKDVAFFYTHKLFKRLVTEGGLK